MPLRRVPRAATQQGEPVVQPAGDLGDRHDPHARGRQLDRQRQPVQAAAQLSHGARGRSASGRAALARCPNSSTRGREVSAPAGGTPTPTTGRAGCGWSSAPAGPCSSPPGRAPARRRRDDVLAVVQHQQRRARAEGAHDARRAIRPAPPGGPPPPARPAHRRRDRRDLGRDVVVGSDTGERDEVYDALFRPAADGVREPGLAQAARTDDGGDPGRTQQARPPRRCRRRGRAAGWAHAGRRAGSRAPRACSSRWYTAWSAGPGSLPNSSRKRPAVAPRTWPAPLTVPPSRPRSAATPAGPPHPAAARRDRRAPRLPRPAAPAATAPPRGRAHRSDRYVDAQRSARQLGHRVTEQGVAAGRSPLPQREPRLGMRERRRVVTLAGTLCARGRAVQDGGRVDLVLAQGKPVPGGCAGDEVGAQLCPGAGDQDLKRLGRVLGPLVRPEPVHQPYGAAARARSPARRASRPRNRGW